MRSVEKTKKLSIPQISRMALNLGEKFTSSAHISIDTWSYTGQDESTQSFWLWVDTPSISGIYLETWEKLQNHYFQLMDKKD